MKTCTKCGVEKDRALFSTQASSKDGLQYCCKACVSVYNAAHYAADPEKVKASSAAYREANPEKARATQAACHTARPEKGRARVARYRKAHPEKGRAKQAKRRATKLQATPAWADHTKIGVVYTKAQEWGMAVDHIVPLRSKIVCGLHCWGNLQLLVAPENLFKGNRCWPDMPEVTTA